jgi:hypothetical protein
MEPHLIIIEELMVVGMDVVGIKGDILKIFQERIPHPTNKSGITMKQCYMEMEEVYRINPQKTHEEKCHRCGRLVPSLHKKDGY